MTSSGRETLARKRRGAEISRTMSGAPNRWPQRGQKRKSAGLKAEQTGQAN